MVDTPDPLAVSRGRVAAAVAELDRAGDLAAALEAVAHLEHLAGEVRERLAVVAVLGEGWSYARLGRALGTTRQAASKTYGSAVTAEMRRRRRQITAQAVAAGEITVKEIPT